MNQKLLFVLFCFFSQSLFSQVGYTANDQAPTYDKQFLVGINPGWNGNQWSDQQLADLSFGNPSLNVDGIGMQTFRIPLPEEFLDYWGYDIREAAFQHYEDIGMRDLTVFLQSPAPGHKDTTVYCQGGGTSQLFANMYTPIWDGGANGTPVNDTNYAALYFYKTVTMYKDNVRFWEIWNEPDFGGNNCGWKPAGMPGNWFDNTPGPCETQLRAPVYHYIRLLKIAYEVIKSLDEDAFIAVGGVGFESYVDVLCRFTDNPIDGSVTAEYPLKGGAYFDALSFHSYPHFNGTLSYFDSLTNMWVPRRHSDAAADGIINHKNRFQAVLDTHGYDGTTYPKKTFIITETGLPRKSFNDWIGSTEAQRNYMMKVQIAAYQNDIRQIDFYVLAEQNSLDQATNWLEVMGLYQQINNSQPFDATPNESGIGCRTMTDMIGDATYDVAQTAFLNLPDEVNGGAFKMSNGDFRYVLWAATQTDNSEVASFEYSFPDLGFNAMEFYNWDYSTANNVELIPGTIITLTGNPTFIDLAVIFNNEEVTFLENVNISPNPFNDIFEIEFLLLEKNDVQIEISDTQGKVVKSLLEKNLFTGKQKITIQSDDFPTGVYFVKIKTEEQESIGYKLVKM